MAGSEIRDLVLRIRSDTSEAEKGVQRVGKSFTELNQAAELAEKAFSLVTRGAQVLLSVINRGQEVFELSNAFEALQKRAGNLASNELQQLRESTQGLISDTNLMRSANEALLAGLTPKQFEELAKAADTLGDAIGVNATDALQQLTTAANTGQERLLKLYGITIDNKKAEEEFAKSIGLTAKELNEAGKKEAARLAILEKIKEQTEKVAGATDGGGGTLSDALTKAGNAAETFYNKFALFVDNSPKIAAAISQATQQIQDLTNALVGSEKEALLAQKRLLEQGKKELENPDFIERTLLKVKALTDPSSNGNAEIERVKVLSKTNEELRGINKAIGDIEDKEYRKQLELELQTWVPYSEEIKNARNRFGEFGKGQDEAAKKAEELRKKIDEQVTSFQKLGEQANIDSLGEALQKSIEDLDQTSFSNLSTQYEKALTDAARKSLLEQNKEAIAAGRITAEQVEAQATDIAKKEIGERAEEYARAQKEAFQNSVDFFADILTTTIDGTAQDIEQILEDALKRVAIGFASQIAASIAAEVLGPGASGLLSQIGSAQGFGQSLGALVLGGGGPLAALFGGAGGSTIPGSPGFIGPVQPGVPGTPSLLSGTPVGGFSLTAAIPSIVAAVGAYFVATESVGGIKSLANGGKLSLGQQAALALPTFGTSFAFNAVSDFFGGDSQKAQERENREALLDKIIEQIGGDTFQGFSGPIKLSDKKFNIGDSSELTGQITGLVNPFAQLLSGGDDKLGSDLAGIFTNALGGAEDFNEALLDAQVLMGKLGFSAEDAKNAVTELFLDGKISLEEFNTDIQNLNILALDSLPGLADVAGAIELLSKNLDDTERRQALKAIELAFKEMAEAGIDSVSEIHDYILQNFGPDVVKVFDQLAILGIDSFEDLAAAGPEALGPLFGALSELQALMADTGDTGEDAGNQTARAFDGAGSSARRAARETRNYRDELEKTLKKAKELDAFGGSRGDSASQDSNNNLNVRGP